MDTIDGLTKYLEELSRELTCSAKRRKEFLEQTRYIAEDFLQGKPDATFEDLENFLGLPSELAATFQESIPLEERQHYQTKRHHVFFSAATMVVAIAIFSSAFLCYSLNHGRYAHVVETIMIYQPED